MCVAKHELDLVAHLPAVTPYSFRALDRSSIVSTVLLPARPRPLVDCSGPLPFAPAAFPTGSLLAAVDVAVALLLLPADLVLAYEYASPTTSAINFCVASANNRFVAGVKDEGTKPAFVR